MGHRRPPPQGQLPSCGFHRHNCGAAAQRGVAPGLKGSRWCTLAWWAACGEAAGGGARDTTPRPSMPGAAGGTDGLRAALLAWVGAPIVRAPPFVHPQNLLFAFYSSTLPPLPRPPERSQSTCSCSVSSAGPKRDGGRANQCSGRAGRSQEDATRPREGLMPSRRGRARRLPGEAPAQLPPGGCRRPGLQLPRRPPTAPSPAHPCCPPLPWPPAEVPCVRHTLQGGEPAAGGQQRTCPLLPEVRPISGKGGARRHPRLPAVPPCSAACKLCSSALWLMFQLVLPEVGLQRLACAFLPSRH